MIGVFRGLTFRKSPHNPTIPQRKTPMALVQSFDFKLPGMRKPRNFVVYPKSANDKGYLKVQAEGCIGLIVNLEDGRGLFNSKNEYALMNALPFTFPMEFVKKAIECQPKSGDSMSGVCTIA